MAEQPHRLRIVLELDGAVVVEVPAGSLVRVDDHRVVRAAAGVEPPAERHRVELNGRRLDRRSTARRVAAGLGVVDDGPVAPDVTVRDHLAAIVSRRRADELLAGCPHLAGRGPDPAGWLSGGERRLLAWLVCDATAPTAVVLDGAFRGLDLPARVWAEAVLDGWLDRGVAVLRHDPA